MKFLILRFSSIGDIVLTTPLVRCLKKKFPDAEIHYATKKSFQSIIQHNPYITKVHVLENSLVNLSAELRKEKFDYVIDLHHNQRTWLLKLLLGVKSFSFNKINFEKWLYANFKINYLPQQHIVDRYLATCQTLAVENDGEGLDYFIDECDRIDLKSLPAEFQNGYVAWVIGAKQNTKKFPATKIANTILHPAFPKYPVVLLGGNEDEKDGEKIKAMTHASNISVLNACGKYSLNQSASLLQQAKLVVANDTGLMHIAAAFKKTVISIWGNTVPAFGMSPYYGNREIKNAKIEIENLNCRPCSKLGYSSCPQKHFNCMNMIDEEKLVRQIEMLLRTN